MRVGRANSRYLNSYWATTVLQTLPRLRGVAMSGSSSCDRMESLCCSGRASVGRAMRDGKHGTASAVVTRPLALGICGICEIEGCPELVCSTGGRVKRVYNSGTCRWVWGCSIEQNWHNRYAWVTPERLMTAMRVSWAFGRTVVDWKT